MHKFASKSNCFQIASIITKTEALVLPLNYVVLVYFCSNSSRRKNGQQETKPAGDLKMYHFFQYRIRSRANDLLGCKLKKEINSIKHCN